MKAKEVLNGTEHEKKDLIDYRGLYIFQVRVLEKIPICKKFFVSFARKKNQELSILYISGRGNALARIF